MPKDILPINFFEGGYNSASTSRDIEDNQLAEAINVETSVKGAVKCLGEFDTFLDVDTADNGSQTSLNNVDCKGGYGIHMFSIERTLATSPNNLITDPGGYYLAIYKPSAASPRILFYNEPQEVSNTNVINDTIGDITLVGGGNGDNAQTQFISVDGGLRIYDRNFNFKPHRLATIPKGRHLFRNSANNSACDLDYTNETWRMDLQFVRPPSGGYAILDATTFTLGANEVGLNVKSAGQQGSAVVPVGWGQDENTPREYYFFASFVYDGQQESCMAQLNTTPIKLGGGGQGGGTSNNDISFTPIVNAGTNASNWNPRITSVRIYYRDKEYSKDTKYLIGDFPTQSSDNTGVSEDLNQSNWSGYVGLAGEKNAYSTDATLGLPINVGNYFKSPPTVFTHAVMSGLREDTVSTECFYRTGCVVNRKLYVGNVRQKTVDNPLEEVTYGDRMLKSVPNRFDVLPDTEFIDVNIKDGEDIIKLAAFNNRLLQFKERTLYVIVVAGVEEYLEAKFDYMGITHPEACVVTDVGIAWVNKTGAYIFTGEGRPQNMVSGKIDKDEWAAFITDNSIVGFDPVTMQFLVIKDSTNMETTGETGTTCDMYVHNMLTGSWNRAVDKLGDGGTGHDNMSNICNYTDVNGNNHCLHFIQKGNLVEWVSAKKYATNQSPNAYTIKPFNLITKEVTGGAPHLRKKFYKVYITYKGQMASNKPTVKAIFTTPTGNSTITLDAATDFANASDWTSAEFKVATNDLATARNVYSVQIQVEGENVNQEFELNDMSIIFRSKGVK